MKKNLFKKSVIKKSEAEKVFGGYPIYTIGERTTIKNRPLIGPTLDKEPYTDIRDSGAQNSGS